MAEEKGSGKVWAVKRQTFLHQKKFYGYGEELPASVGKERLEELESLGQACDPIENEVVIDVAVTISTLKGKIKSLESDVERRDSKIKKLESNKGNVKLKEAENEISALIGKITDLENEKKEAVDKIAKLETANQVLTDSVTKLTADLDEATK